MEPDATTLDDSAPAAPALPDDLGAEIEAVDALLTEVERSLERIDAGRYGRCQGCGAVIDDARLAEHPTATRCASCEAPSVDDVPDPDPVPAPDPSGF